MERVFSWKDNLLFYHFTLEKSGSLLSCSAVRSMQRAACSEQHAVQLPRDTTQVDQGNLVIHVSVFPALSALYNPGNAHLDVRE